MITDRKQKAEAGRQPLAHGNAASAFRRSLLTVCLVLSAFCLLPSCRRAEVEPHAPRVETRVTVSDPPYAMRRATDPPWYSDMQVLLEEKPADEKELQAYIASHKEPVRTALTGALNEISKTVEDQRKASDKWSILSLNAGRAKRANEIHFIAEVGLTKLYSHRPVININGVPLDLCVAKLAREAEIQDAQTRGHNPVITWEKNDVSAHDALEAIVPSHGFDVKFTYTSYRVELKAQDYNSRKEFIDAITSAILAKCKDLNTVRAAVVITPRSKTETTGTENKPADAKPQDVKPPDASAPDFTTPDSKGK